MTGTTPPPPATPADTLPLDLAWPEIREKLGQHKNLVLVAEPGAGKTTRFPPQLLKSGFLPGDKKIIMLEPRRLAARASAFRIAEEQDWKLGAEIGYQVRFENRTSRETRIEILTEGLLSRRLQSDPELSDVGAVILDEFHERSQHTDLALGLLFELQQLARPDLRLIVMSATLDADRVSSFLDGAPIVRVPGRTHPVEIHHGKRPLSLETGFAFTDQVAETVFDLLSGRKSREGDILIFLPGAREIRNVGEKIRPEVERFGGVCVELHGSLSLEEQNRAIKRDPRGRIKIVLATNIAETSLTIDGVGTVIDSGLARVSRLDAIGFPRLVLSRISLASATQRSGRAGRQAPGQSYRLWSKLDESSMPAFEVPEILRTDLGDPILALLSQGVTDPFGFSWFEKPSNESLQRSLDSLTDLGLRDARSGALTPQGRRALQLPLSARLARLVLESVQAGATALGADLAALLSEKDIATRAHDLKRQASLESDLVLRLHLLRDARSSNESFAIKNVRRVADSIVSAASRLRHEVVNEAPDSSPDDDLAMRLLARAFPDRLCRRRRKKEAAARMVGGKGVTLAPYSSVETADFFVALDASEPPPHLGGPRSDAQITIASRVEREWLEQDFPTAISKKAQIIFDDESLTVQKQTATFFRDLPLEDPHISRPTFDEAFDVLMRAAESRWDSHLATSATLQSLLERLRFLRLELSEGREFEFDEFAVRRACLEEVCFGETKLNDVLAKDLADVYLRHLPSRLSRLLSESAPSHIVVPSGSRIRVHYPEARPPYLEVRIQEVFGWRETPKLANGKVSVVMHLLGPNYRPMQVTADLASFWQNGYPEVRKELRARYPKHSWPDDPTTAPAVARGRPRK